MLTKMPRDCTALPIGGLFPPRFSPDVQSPVLVSGDPMSTPKRQNKQKKAESRPPKPAGAPKQAYRANKKANGNGPRGSSALAFAPTAMARIVRNAKPAISYQKGGSCNIKHVEYVSDVTGSAVFASTAVAIQPGLVSSFPWLSNIARRFETYHFRVLRIWYLVESATSETGFILYAVDYDAADAAPTSKLQAMSYEESVRGVPWEEFCHVCQSANLSKYKQYYVRNAALASNLDIKTYDVGNLFICTGGNVGTAGRGELYFEYDIDLFTPQLHLEDQVSGGSIAGGGNMSAASPLGDAPVVDPQSVGLAALASVVTLSYPGTYAFAGLLTGNTITAFGLTGSTGVTVTVTGVPASGGATAAMEGSVISTVTGGTFTVTSSAVVVSACVIRLGNSPTGSQS